jgi:hypothetical protein
MRHLTLLILTAAVLASCIREPKYHLRVGAAALSVNPPVGAYIAGDRPNRQFTGFLDSLYVRAVAVDDGKTLMAIATVDCIGLLYPTVQQIREAAAARTPDGKLRPEHIIITSTHTHAGPDVVGIWGPEQTTTGVDESYMTYLVERGATAIKQAVDGLERVRAYTSETSHGDDWVANICNEEIDRSVTTLWFKRPDGREVASLTNFACHPTILDAKHNVVSSDYPGYFYNKLDTEIGGVNLFLQGAIGGWVQPVNTEGTPEMAKVRGEGLALSVIESMKTGRDLDSTTLEVRSQVFAMPVENKVFMALAGIGVINRDINESVVTEVAWFRIGNLQGATHPGETAPFYGLETKKMMGKGPNMVLGLGLDAMGYILKPHFFENDSVPHSEYLTSMSVGREAGPLVMENLRAIIPQ